MLKVHLEDGQTLRFDLTSNDDAARWLALAKQSQFQSQITGLSINYNGVQYSLPKPQGFESVFFNAELIEPNPGRKVKGGERLLCHAGEIGLILMAHREQRAARIDVTRLGKQRYNPVTNGSG